MSKVIWFYLVVFLMFFSGCGLDHMDGNEAWDLKESERASNLDFGSLDHGYIDMADQGIVGFSDQGQSDMVDQGESQPQGSEVRVKLNNLNDYHDYEILGIDRFRSLEFRSDNVDCTVRGIRFKPNEESKSSFFNVVETLEFDIGYSIQKNEAEIVVMFDEPFLANGEITYTIKTYLYGKDRIGMEVPDRLSYNVDPIFSVGCYLAEKVKDYYEARLLDPVIHYYMGDGYTYPIKDGVNHLAKLGLSLDPDPKHTEVLTGDLLKLHVVNLCFEVKASSNIIFGGLLLQGDISESPVFTLDRSASHFDFCLDLSGKPIVVEHGFISQVKLVSGLEVLRGAVSMEVKLTKVKYKGSDPGNHVYTWDNVDVVLSSFSY